MLQDQLQADFLLAMKEKNSVKKDILSYVLAQIKNKQIESGRRQEQLSDDDIIQLIKKEIKMRKESMDYLYKAQKHDAMQEEGEKVAFLEAYLPSMVSKEDLISLVRVTITTLAVGDLSKERGRVIAAIMESHRSVVDGQMLNDIISSML